MTGQCAADTSGRIRGSLRTGFTKFACRCFKVTRAFLTKHYPLVTNCEVILMIIRSTCMYSSTTTWYDRQAPTRYTLLLFPLQAKTATYLCSSLQVRGTVVSPAHQNSSPGAYDDFVNLKIICRLNLSKMLIGVRCACAFIRLSVCAYV